MKHRTRNPSHPTITLIFIILNSHAPSFTPACRPQSDTILKRCHIVDIFENIFHVVMSKCEILTCLTRCQAVLCLFHSSYFFIGLLILLCNAYSVALYDCCVECIENVIVVSCVLCYKITIIPTTKKKAKKTNKHEHNRYL